MSGLSFINIHGQQTWLLRIPSYGSPIEFDKNLYSV